MITLKQLFMQYRLCLMVIYSWSNSCWTVFWKVTESVPLSYKKFDLIRSHNWQEVAKKGFFLIIPFHLGSKNLATEFVFKVKEPTTERIVPKRKRSHNSWLCWSTHPYWAENRNVYRHGNILLIYTRANLKLQQI